MIQQDQIRNFIQKSCPKISLYIAMIVSTFTTSLCKINQSLVLSQVRRTWWIVMASQGAVHTNCGSRRFFFFAILLHAAQTFLWNKSNFYRLAANLPRKLTLFGPKDFRDVRCLVIWTAANTVSLLVKFWTYPYRVTRPKCHLFSYVTITL